MKILLHVPVNPNTGYGNDGLGLSRTLARMGHDVTMFPVTVTPPIPEEFAKILTGGDLRGPFDLTLVHLDPTSLRVGENVRALSKWVVGWTMWEWDTYQPKRPEYRKALLESLRDYDALFCYDEVTHKALRPFVPSTCESFVQQGGVWSEDWEFARDRDWSGTFRYASLGDLHHERKNPRVLIEAFAHLKRTKREFDAELHLKVHPTESVDLFEGLVDDVFIYQSTWTQEQVRQFYGRIHCYVAPSAGEGKNLPAMEAQLTGCPAIVSGVGGHLEWADPSFVKILPVHWEKFEEGAGGKVDVAMLAEAMWEMYEDRQYARALGAKAADKVYERCEWSVVVPKMLRRVESLRGREVAMPLG